MYIDAHSHRPSPGAGIFTLMSCFPAEVPDLVPPHTRLCAGIHPWQTAKVSPALGFAMETTRKLADEGKIMAVGECGLDLLKGGSLTFQKSTFCCQLEIAERNRLPVVVHAVRAHDEILTLRKKYYGTPWLMHGFNGSAPRAAQLRRAGCIISLGPPFFRRVISTEMVEFLRKYPFLLETDDSGDDIIALYRRAAELLNIDLPVMAQRLEDNFTAVFGAIPGD